MDNAIGGRFSREIGDSVKNVESNQNSKCQSKIGPRDVEVHDDDIEGFVLYDYVSNGVNSLPVMSTVMSNRSAKKMDAVTSLVKDNLPSDDMAKDSVGRKELSGSKKVPVKSAEKSQPSSEEFIKELKDNLSDLRNGLKKCHDKNDRKDIKEAIKNTEQTIAELEKAVEEKMRRKKDTLRRSADQLRDSDSEFNAKEFMSNMDKRLKEIKPKNRQTDNADREHIFGEGGVSSVEGREGKDESLKIVNGSKHSGKKDIKRNGENPQKEISDLETEQQIRACFTKSSKVNREKVAPEKTMKDAQCGPTTMAAINGENSRLVQEYKRQQAAQLNRFTNATQSNEPLLAISPNKSASGAAAGLSRKESGNDLKRHDQHNDYPSDYYSFESEPEPEPESESESESESDDSNSFRINDFGKYGPESMPSINNSRVGVDYQTSSHPIPKPGQLSGGDTLPGNNAEDMGVLYDMPSLVFSGQIEQRVVSKALTYEDAAREYHNRELHKHGLATRRNSAQVMNSKDTSGRDQHNRNQTPIPKKDHQQPSLFAQGRPTKTEEIEAEMISKLGADYLNSMAFRKELGDHNLTNDTAIDLTLRRDVMKACPLEKITEIKTEDEILGIEHGADNQDLSTMMLYQKGLDEGHYQ